jgi:RNA polymerase sigma-70 factor (ECF subfamily)
MAEDSSSTLTETEQALIRRAQKGITASFDRLVDAHYSAVYNITYRMLGEGQSASDATQVAFVRAFEALPGFRGEAAFKTWLYRIAINVCLDEIRRRESAPLSLTAEHEQEGAPTEREIPDQSDEPAGRVEQRERQEMVHRALARLPEDFRSIIVLYDINGLSYQEISDTLRIPLGTVKSRLNRARHALRDELEPHLELFA